ncbi:MAG: DUF3047 domain-containing protein [Acidobacteria bacterium]|nr:DUF3047 domain-containing protein [Acidobacteriota bacterium]
MRLRAILVVAVALAGSQQVPVGVLGGFEPGWRDVWELQQLGGAETFYRVVEEAGDRVLRADADASATAFLRRVELPRVATRISWRWKVAASLSGNTEERQRAGDDYAARLFVIFGEGELSADTRALCYVWAGAGAVGSSYRSPVVDSVMTMVLQSGDELAGAWVEQSRDFAADYRRAFGREPGRVGAIALLVDTDDTGRRATAWYDDIIVR